jgi:hypothetical protein
MQIGKSKAFLRQHLGSTPSRAPQPHPPVNTPHAGESPAPRAGRQYLPERTGARVGEAQHCSSGVGQSPQDGGGEEREE